MKFIRIKGKNYSEDSLNEQQQNLVEMFKQITNDLDSASAEVNKCKLALSKIEDLLGTSIEESGITDVSEEDVKRELENGKNG